MAVRRLLPAHASAYQALMLEAYALHPDAFTSSAAERAVLAPDWWAARLSGDSQAAEIVVGVFQGQCLAGVAGLAFESREEVRHKARLFGMYVAVRFRRRGFGRQLVQAALAEAKTRTGMRVVQLTVTQGNQAAQALYVQCGFVPFGIEPLAVAVGAGFVSKIQMWCDVGTSEANARN
ncbi:MAG: GNAT family N-acetyltransferase [Proteobacteria bacterium]|nr:MAG: GNAT family N-acetyltransferase [Pseudomonadota bacterium]QKK10289.1 MAG: GNAT family N-acetyltransferase [Pseudomonadota bacterium]